MEKERPILGCFAAASNVTGHLVDVESISHLFHKYNGLVFFDYATAGINNCLWIPGTENWIRNLETKKIHLQY